MITSTSLVRFCILGLGIFNVSYKSMGRWVGGKHSPSLQRPVNLDDWNFIFFCNRMCQDRNFPIVEKVKNPVIDCAQPGSQVINTIPQKICFGSAQFVPELSRLMRTAHLA